MNNKYNYQIAECVGLWLAEGDDKTNYEITFTNNSLFLVEYFHKNIVELFKNYKFNVRIYIYSSNKEKIKIPIKNCKINRYIDIRANKPYFIWRLASVELNRRWKDVVKEIQNNNIFYQDIIRGFFAGEGNIKVGSHYNRALRISQGKPLRLIELILENLGICYKYYDYERSYVIHGKMNWDKCANIKMADLHPIKKLNFWKVYNTFKEEHYKINYIRDKLLLELNKPYTSFQLSLKFKRSHARISEVLVNLKKQGLINNFRVKSKDLWIKNDQNIIILSDIKKKYLKYLNNYERNTKEISKKFNVCWKSSFRRLCELRKLGLVERKENKKWRINNTNKKLVTWY